MFETILATGEKISSSRQKYFAFIVFILMGIFLFQYYNYSSELRRSANELAQLEAQRVLRIEQIRNIEAAISRERASNTGSIDQVNKLSSDLAEVSSELQFLSSRREELENQNLLVETALETLAIVIAALSTVMILFTSSRVLDGRRNTGHHAASLESRNSLELEMRNRLLDRWRNEDKSEAELSSSILQIELVDRIRKHGDRTSDRVNINLIIGIGFATGGVILLFFLFFVFRPGLPGLNTSYLTHSLLQYLPRLTLVLIVEFVAFFFLRSYRSSLGELRYLTNEITNIEFRIFALLQAKDLGEKTFLKSMLADLLSTERNFVFDKSQTTIDLEKSLAEDKAFKDQLELFSGLLKDAVGEFRKSEGNSILAKS